MCSSNDTQNNQPLAPKAVALLSGGLDSALAVHMVKSQGVEVVAVHFASFFSAREIDSQDSTVSKIARQLDVELISLEKGDDFLDLIKNPRFGYGKNLNPCIDCRIYTLKMSKTIMEEIGASFIVTGEVVGQRPMSQRGHTMRMIEKQAGCQGILVRPLSAKLLSPSLPETTGLLDREKLLDIAGRGRKTQLRLADEIRLEGYQTPAGGCLLTDKGFSTRLRDLLDDGGQITRQDLDLLAMGRHIRIRSGLKTIVGRKQAENEYISDRSSGRFLFFPRDFPGPVALAQGRPSQDERMLIGSIIRRYAKPAVRREQIVMRDPECGDSILRVQDVASEDWIAAHLI